MSDVQHCSTCRCTDDWPDLPNQVMQDPVGQQIRCRSVTALAGRLVRLGNSEPKAIVAETRDFVIYEVWSAGGKSLGQRAMTKQVFEQNFERRMR